MAQLALNPIGGVECILQAAHVELHRKSASTRVPNFIGGITIRTLDIEIGNRDFGALARKAQRDRTPDALCGAGDIATLSFNRLIDASILLSIHY